MSDDFFREDPRPGRTEEEKSRARMKAWRVIRPILITLVSLVLCALLFGKIWNYLLEKFYYPVDLTDATPVTVTVPSGYGASSIAKLLYEAGGEGQPGLITSKAVFKVYVDFTGKSSKLRAGTYVLSRNMDIGQIVDVICEGNPPRQTVKLTITEGMDVEAIAAKLVELGVLSDTTEFLAACNDPDSFQDFAFVTEIPNNTAESRRYVLEGYLFPDTYEIYTDASVNTIINKLLLRFFEVFTDDYIARAKELGMSIDDVVTLASIIEKEAKTSDFSKVSAVFHNRLDQGIALGSDATLGYIFKTNAVEYTKGELENASLYNTYKYTGLPLGPITNPGKTALEAALYPDKTFLADGYLYFCLKDGETGELIFAKTLEEHNANIEKYRPYWGTN